MASFEQVTASFWDVPNQHLRLPPLTDDMIIEAELRLGVTLPADLLHLLHRRNGGVVSDAWDACPAPASHWAADCGPTTGRSGPLATTAPGSRGHPA